MPAEDLLVFLFSRINIDTRGTIPLPACSKSCGRCPICSSGGAHNFILAIDFEAPES